MPNQRNIIGYGGDHQKQIKDLFPGYQTKVNPGYTHKDQYFDNANINKNKFELTQPKMWGATAYEVPAQAALDSLYSADYLKKYTPKVEEVNARRARLNTNLAPISPYFNALLPDTNIQFHENLTPVDTDTLTSRDSNMYIPYTQAISFGVQEAVDDGKHTKFLDPRYGNSGIIGYPEVLYNGFYPVQPDFSKEYTYPQQVFDSFKNHELGHFANFPNTGVFNLETNSNPSLFNYKYYNTPEGSTYGKYMKFPEEQDTDYGSKVTYNQDPSEFYNFLGQVKRWGPKFGFDGTMDTSDMTKHRQAMMDTVNHIMNLKPEDIDDIELLRAHNFLNTAKQNYPYNMQDPIKVRQGRGAKYSRMADDAYQARLKELGIGDQFDDNNLNEHTYNTINQSLADKGQSIVDSWIPYRQYKYIDDDYNKWLDDTRKDLSPAARLDSGAATPTFVESVYPNFKDRHSKEDLIKYFKFRENYRNFYNGLRDERRAIEKELMERDPMFQNRSYLYNTQKLRERDPMFKNMEKLKLHNPEEVIPSMILDQVSDDDLRALVRNRRSSANKGALQRLMYS